MHGRFTFAPDRAIRPGGRRAPLRAAPAAALSTLRSSPLWRVRSRSTASGKDAGSPPAPCVPPALHNSTARARRLHARSCASVHAGRPIGFPWTRWSAVGLTEAHRAHGASAGLRRRCASRPIGAHRPPAEVRRYFILSRAVFCVQRRLAPPLPGAAARGAAAPCRCPIHHGIQSPSDTSNGTARCSIEARY